MKNLIIFPFVIFSMFLPAQESNTDSLESIDQNTERNFPISNVPAGTHMVIPEFVLKEFQEIAGQWEDNPAYYLGYRYGVAKPSLLEKGTGTFFVPLSPLNSEGNIMMVDIRNVRFDEENNHYITIKDAPHYVNVEDKKTFPEKFAKQ